MVNPDALIPISKSKLYILHPFLDLYIYLPELRCINFNGNRVKRVNQPNIETRTYRF